MKAKKVMKEGWKKNGRIRKVKQKKCFCKNNDVIQMEDSQKRHKKSSMKSRRRKEKKNEETEKKGRSPEKNVQKKENLSNAEEVNK